jgi:hypothetical protein
MSGHRKFSQLTKNFSPERNAEIAKKTNNLRKELSNLRQSPGRIQITLVVKLNAKQSSSACALFLANTRYRKDPRSLQIFDPKKCVEVIKKV